MKKSPKYHFTLTIAGIFLIGIVAYKFAFSRTFDKVSLLNELEDKASMLKNADMQIAQYIQLNNELSSMIGQTEEGKTFSEILLEYTTKSCSKNSLVLKEFPAVHYAENASVLFETYSLTLEGTYRNLLNYIYEFETQSKLGNISSIKFETVKNRKKKRDELHATIYVQKIKKI